MKRRRFLPKTRQAELALIAVTVVWGLTFSLIKKSLDEVSPFVFMFYRFALAFLFMAAVSVNRLRRMTRRTAAAGLLLGVFLYGAYSLQTIGLEYTSAGNAGFITGLFVVFVPILSALFLRKRPGLRSAFSIVLATTGLALLSLQPGMGINLGDALVLGCAFVYSLHIMYMDRFVQHHDLVLLTLVQMGVVTVLHAVSGLVFEDFVFPTGGFVWMSIAVCGILASAVAFFVQAWAQRVISPVRTSMVLIMEPVFSVLFGIVLLEESLSWRGWLGCAIMLAAMFITEAKPEG